MLTKFKVQIDKHLETVIYHSNKSVLIIQIPSILQNH